MDRKFLVVIIFELIPLITQFLFVIDFWIIIEDIFKTIRKNYHSHIILYSLTFINNNPKKKIWH